MKIRQWHLKSLLVFSLVASFWLVTPMRGQNAGAPDNSMQPQDRNPMPDQDRDRNRDKDDITRHQLAEFDQFMDGHPEIAEQLRKDPSLVDNREFVANHPALQAYLRDHPNTREEIKENPRLFMHAEERYDRREDPHADQIDRRQLAGFDQFMDSHPEIAEQLRKDPSLVDKREFVQGHPALQAYLQEHPDTRAEIDAHPDAFMRREERYDRYEDRRTGGDRDTRGDLATFGEFLGGHSNIADQISKDPSLLKNQEYMANHPDLQAYLKAHPGAQAQLTQNPDSFIRSAQQLDSSGRVKTPAVDPAKPKQ